MAIEKMIDNYTNIEDIVECLSVKISCEKLYENVLADFDVYC